MNTSTLQMFSVLANKLSYTEAARQLEISQPTLSRKIQQLEVELKVHLFHRSGSSIHLTPQGEEFLQTTRQLLAMLDQSFDRLQDSARSICGELKLALLHPTAEMLSERFIPEFHRIYPGVSVHLITIQPCQLKEIGDADLMISPYLPYDKSLIARRLFSFERLFYASPDYLRLRGCPEAPEQLSAFNCIVNNCSIDPEPSWQWQDRDGHKGRVAVNGTVSANTFDIALNLARAGVGIACLPRQIAEQYPDQLTPLFDGHCFQAVDMSVIYRSRQYLPNRYRVFIEALKQHFAEYCQQTAGT